MMRGNRGQPTFPAAEILNFRARTFDGSLACILQPLVDHNTNYRKGRRAAIFGSHFAIQTAAYRAL